MAESNLCIYVDAHGKLSLQDAPERYQPSVSQALVRVEYSGINPADIAHARFLRMGDNVCGYDFCGTVIEAASESRYAVGDTVFGSNEVGRGRPRAHGAHQNFLIVESDSMSMKLPAGVPHQDAAALSIMVRTAADALLNQFGFRFPTIEVPSSAKPGALLIWGGASTVGTATIQLAKAMKVGTIFVTASPSNHEALTQLGASRCFDYRSPDVLQAIRAAIDEGGVPLTYVFDTVCKPGGPNGPGTVELCESLPASSDVIYASTLPQPQSPRWKTVLASRSRDFPFPPPLTSAKGSPALDVVLESAMRWAAENYGNGFRIPKVTIVSGSQAGMEAINDVFEGRSSFQKVVIEHPF